MGSSSGATRRTLAARSLFSTLSLHSPFNTVCRYTTHTVGVVAAHLNAVHTHTHYTTFAITATRGSANQSQQSSIRTSTPSTFAPEILCRTESRVG